MESGVLFVMIVHLARWKQTWPVGNLDSQAPLLMAMLLPSSKYDKLCVNYSDISKPCFVHFIHAVFLRHLHRLIQCCTVFTATTAACPLFSSAHTHPMATALTIKK